jgi:hypothetical protein
VPGGSEAVVADSWDTPFPGVVLNLETRTDWDGLHQLYARGINNAPLTRCLQVAEQNGARRAVVETRYIDPDYRSEYTAFYARSFANFPDSAHRIHFFKSREVNSENLTTLPDDPGYLGYMVIRPLRITGAVGRTMLTPPPDLASRVRTAVEEVVHFFGQPLCVRAVPFMQQDGQFGRCAHIAVWVCHYTAYLRHEVTRRPVAYFSVSSNPSLGTGRTLPVDGLTVPEILVLLRLLEMHVKHYSVRKMIDNDRASTWLPRVRPTLEARIARINRRFMDSGLPYIVVAQEQFGRRLSLEKHSFVVCGYVRDNTSTHLVVNDDQRGPYISVDSVRAGRSKIGASDFNWEQLIVPLPEKLWMTGETAERMGSVMMIGAARLAARSIPAAQKVVDKHDAGRLRLCTYAIRNNAFKQSVRERFKGDPIIVEMYNLARLSRYVWVVEIIDNDLRNDGSSEYVVGEIVFDPTSGNSDPVPLVTRLPGVISIRVGEDETITVPTSDASVTSGGTHTW